MSDIVERLRELSKMLECSHPATMERAADEIERLRAALREHACRCEQRCVDVWEDVREHVEPTKADCRFHRARAALGEKT